jgi:methyl-accepting chemotaxis protein
VTSLTRQSAENATNAKLAIEQTHNRDVTELSGAIQAIANSAASQAENLSQINLSVSDLDRSTQQNAAMAEQCTAAATSLSQEANTLNGALSQFEVGMDSQARASSPLLARAA